MQVSSPKRAMLVVRVPMRILTRYILREVEAVLRARGELGPRHALFA